MFVVLGYRNDCGDSEAFMVEDVYGHDNWTTFDEARLVMLVSYKVMSDEYAPGWSRDGCDKRKRRIRKASAEFAVPIWDAGRKCESWLKCRWKVVEI